ncbi:PB1 domain [Dillenia turbinata]|uniref:PB1 domain n=1 Tax=Dillenia turbinata TaxID=194707 RepID=A0AAN8ZQM1_9MAGN
MEDGSSTPNSIALSGLNADFDFMDELLFEGCWVETTETCSNFQQVSSTSNAVNYPVQDYLNSETNTSISNPNKQQESCQRETSRQDLPNYQSSVYKPFEVQSDNQIAFEIVTSSFASERFTFERMESGKRWWFGLTENSCSASSVLERLMLALKYIQNSTRDKDVLIQIWVPTKLGNKRVLTTYDSLFSLESTSENLVNYRNVSKTYQFSTDVDSKEFAGLPGRVFMRKAPEWTPDVWFFKAEEYQRIDYAKQYDVHGSLAVPVLQQGSGSCLGVIEIITTTQKIKYRPVLENICKALEAVDLRSSEIIIPPNVQACNESYQVALPEIYYILKSACQTHRLPLAQTWAPCIQQGKRGSWHSGDDYAHCISTIDPVYYASDPQMVGFHEACVEQHLFGGQGVVGCSFSSTQPYLATDITAFSKTRYPLSHHARMFGLHAAVAICLRSISLLPADFVLEFFLPVDCTDTEEEELIVNSLIIIIQQVCRHLDFPTDKNMGVETTLPCRKTNVVSDGRLNGEETGYWVPSPQKASSSQEDSTWISRVMEGQWKGQGVCISFGCQKKEPREEFKVTTHWDNEQSDFHHGQSFSGFELLQEDSGLIGNDEDVRDSSSIGQCTSFCSRKAGEKKRTKAEKTISLQVLRQYFTGSLKDAAKSIGVCPTTLKRICRQHGITRWPSRKIKKVGHTLKKLQRVIDSVQGAECSIPISSFYANFPRLNSPVASGTSPYSTSKTIDQTNQSPEARRSTSPGVIRVQIQVSCSTGPRQTSETINVLGGEHALMAEDPGGVLKRTRSDAELLVSTQEEPKLLTRSLSHKSFGEHPNLENLPPLSKHSPPGIQDTGAYRVKVSFGEEKIRFSMQANEGFVELQREILRHFGVNDTDGIDLKYMDDDCEWVLLTCDADLEDCIDIYRSVHSYTIRLSVHQTSHSKLGSSYAYDGSARGCLVLTVSTGDHRQSCFVAQWPLEQCFETEEEEEEEEEEGRGGDPRIRLKSCQARVGL